MENTAKSGQQSTRKKTAPLGSDGGRSSSLVYTPISQTHNIQAIEIYKKSTKFIRPKMEGYQNAIPPVRTEIQGFSSKSRSRLCFLADNPASPLISQLGLTYHNRTPDGKTAKKHLNHFLTLIRKHYPAAMYLWIAEFQSRGVLHYHLFLTLPHDTEGLHEFLASNWHRIAEPESSKHLWFHRRSENFIKWDMCSTYLAHKYLSKEAQKTIPSGFLGMGRFWGNSRNLLATPQICTPSDMAFLATPDIPSPFDWMVRNIGKLHERRIKQWQRNNSKKLWKSRIRKGCSSITLSHSVQQVKQIILHLKTCYEKKPNLPF